MVNLSRTLLLSIMIVSLSPMALSVNPERFTDAKKIEKWFHRNCTWVLGRVCTAQEKSNILSYLQQQ